MQIQRYNAVYQQVCNNCVHLYEKILQKSKIHDRLIFLTPGAAVPHVGIGFSPFADTKKKGRGFFK